MLVLLFMHIPFVVNCTFNTMPVGGCNNIPSFLQ